MFIVASSMDSSTERIVTYLSETHGVHINIATFGYFNTPNGELLGCSLLLDEAAVQTRAENHSTTSHRSSFEQLRALAEENGVVELYDKALDNLKPLFESLRRTMSSVSLASRLRSTGARNAILAIYPEASSASNGLAMLCLVDRVAERFNLSEDQIRAACGPKVTRFPRPVYYPDDVYYFDNHHLEKLIALLNGSREA